MYFIASSFFRMVAYETNGERRNRQPKPKRRTTGNDVPVVRDARASLAERDRDLLEQVHRVLNGVPGQAAQSLKKSSASNVPKAPRSTPPMTVLRQ